jgi:hypothetical protein
MVQPIVANFVSQNSQDLSLAEKYRKITEKHHENMLDIA